MMIEETLWERIEKKRKRLTSLRPLDKHQLELIKKQLEIEYVYNSTSIEGNTLSLNETRLILEEGITIKGKSLREHLDVTNQMEAMKFIEILVKKRNKVVKVDDVLELHQITLKGISNQWAGKYKTSQNRILGSRLKTTPPYQVPEEMRHLVKAINRNPYKYNAIELAAYVHHELVRIHPFLDGNGRAARLLANLILLRKGYPPNIILNKDRKKYFDSLEKAHFGDLKVFMNFFARGVERSLSLYLNALLPTTKSTVLVPLAELAKETRYSQEYLSLLARKGRLPSVKIDGIWNSTRKDLEEYVKSKKRD